MIFSTKHTPRWIIFVIDLSICFFSIIVAYLLRFNFAIPPLDLTSLKYVIPYVILVRAISFLFARTYANIVRYTSTKDAQRIFFTILVGSVFFGIFNHVYFALQQKFLIPTSVIIIDALTTIFIMTFSPLMVKVLYVELRNPGREKTNVIIYGAGELGIITKRALDRDAGTKYKVLGFVDDNSNKIGNKLEGITIYNSKTDLETLLRENNVAHLIFSVKNMHPHQKKDIIELCLTTNTKVLNVPPVNSWINGELSFKQIKKIKIEDLLEREPIELDIALIKQELSGKVILVTGAAGSIGSELCRQIIQFKPQKLILLDQAESALYETELELSDKFKTHNFETVIGDIRNLERMQNVFKTFKPELVFHAAAYKHVPLMESNPSESILTNVLGTKIISDLSVEHGVKKFVMVSTDKAVNPTNVMGATKRIAEIYTQAYNNTQSKTRFITTRFGNVLGSNGSVIPLFRKQIETGGPITVTHPDITRYFMTIPEASQLVLEAGTIGRGGEIFIFDMGESVKIVDLAKKMVKLSGLSLGKDIQLVYTGLRPGEKLYEELLNNQENTLPTHHPKIMVASVKEYDFEKTNASICALVELFNTQDNVAIVRKMKEIVPEFISNNSIFEQLDKITDGATVI